MYFGGMNNNLVKNKKLENVAFIQFLRERTA